MAEVTTSGPRPLQLASGSIITLSTASPYTSGTGPAFDATTSIEQTETNPQNMENEDFQAPLLYTPPSSARAMSRSSTRRHSSISYIRSGAGSPFRESFRRESVDVFMKYPLSATHPASSQFSPVGDTNPDSLLSRTNSLGGSSARCAKNRRASNRASHGLLLGDSKLVDAMKHLKERPPVTVAEKHAELLQFIAQKESKCLELRSQLAIHEAELLQLKRKWELIVNRGFEKPQTTSTSSTSSPSPPSALSPSSPFVGPHAPVLEGIKEGVQGMSRLLAAGFESIAGGPLDLPHSSLQAGASLRQPPPPLPLLLGSVPKLDRKASKRHGQNESQSSTSTTASMSTFAGDSAAATNTGATSVRSSFSFDGSTSAAVSQISIRNDNEQEPEDVRDSLEICEEQSKNSTPSSDRSEQVLIVRDTGATPTMSPNPDFERKRRSKKLSEKRTGALTGSPIKKNIDEEDLDPWLDDGWDAPPSPGTEHQVLKPSVNGRVSGLTETSTTLQSPKSPPSLPPMTIPGLATMNLAGPAAQQVSSWMGSVGKKLGDIRGGSTFTRSQKRASLLLSDMQNTLISSLISPTPVSHPSSASGTIKENLPVGGPIFASNTSTAQSTSSSLLDEFDVELANHTMKPLLTTPILVPSKKTSLRAQPCLDPKEGGNKAESESDDDWNW